jgi:hypothetical protein
MLDVIYEIFAGIAEAIFGDWFNQQSRFTRGLIWVLIITVAVGIIFVLYKLFPAVINFIVNLT